ncbi:oligopeptide:H+ symporter [Sporomusa acidovorans]|uniref:Dipeptide and tripeptide permease B n=1 Tax=Sporomusa acidovorans (strain ATCC 49682 / DSM 3132 / Mol) TaxID=1123286 RepID=A0ABZ3IXC3_SPOA4|nr:oligopeptide:H+ symporter [Sporomusa acidovorans]OZC22337.1 dipeptide and tripeptide permease B [Sporomusa acidovorans DSM 3132]SDE46143.1 proton-dependent oligopeptide transporter, POT family [Sporomusa acidovorans]
MSEDVKSPGLFSQPRAFSIIFFLEIWERWGYYGLQSVLAVFFVKSLGMSDAESFVVFGAFSSMVYGFVAIGGYVGDKVLGTQRTVILGALTLMIGYVLMAIAGANKQIVFAALAFVAVGCGLFKANPGSLMSKMYAQDDSRLDGAFTLYYMAVNIGSFFSMLFVPIIGGKYGLSVGFYLCAIGLILAIVTFVFFRHLLKGVDSPVGLQPLNYTKFAVVIASLAVLIAASTWMLSNLTVAHWILFFVVVTVFLIIFKEIFKSQGIERSKMIVAVVLMAEAVVFFTLFQQVFTSLNFFAIKNVEHVFLGMEVQNPEVFQSLSPFWVLAVSPVLAFLYNYYGNQGRDLSMPAKFATGMSFCAASFLILAAAARYFANSEALVSPWWLVLAYLLISIGELLISGLGLSMISKLMPQHMIGFTMGAYFLTTAISGVTGGWVATLTAAPQGVTDPVQTLSIYSQVFLQIGGMSAAAAALMFLGVASLRRMIHGDGDVSSTEMSENA